MFGGGGGGGFGSAQQPSGFGAFGQQPPQQQQQPSAFGATSGAPSLFGQAPGQQQASPFGAATGAFGAPAATGGAFGAPAGGLFGQQKPAGTSIFGTPAPAQGTTVSGGFGGFGASPASTATAPAFGTGAGMGAFGAGMGAAQGTSAQSNQGTGNPAYAVTHDKDPTMPASAISVFQCINAMPAYKNWSFEELRLADYQLNKKYAPSGPGGVAFGQAAAGTTQPKTGLFGTPTQGTGAFGQATPTGAFGATSGTGSTFGQPATGGLFGQTTTSAFGQPQQQQQQQTGAFGQPPTGGLFGQAAPTTTSAFGQPQQQQVGAFGQPQPTSTGFGGFGQTAAAAPKTGFGFGQPAATTTTTTTTSAFGGPAAGGFGGGSFGAASLATSAFGAKPAAPSLFGQPPGTATTGTGAFGQPAAPVTGTSLFGQPQATTTTGAFGAQPTGGLFGAQPAAAPTTFSLGGGAFGAPAAGSTTGTAPGAGAFGAGTTPGMGFGGTTAAPSFGFGQAQSAQPAPAAPAPSLFGAGGTTGFGFGAKPAGTLGAPAAPAAPVAPVAGTSLFGGFGTAAPAGTTSFGTSTLGVGGSLFGQPVASTAAAGAAANGQVLHASIDKQPYGYNPLFESAKSVTNGAPALYPAAAEAPGTAQKKQPTLEPHFKVTPRSVSKIKLRGISAMAPSPAAQRVSSASLIGAPAGVASISGAPPTPYAQLAEGKAFLEGSPKDTMLLGLDARFTPRKQVKKLTIEHAPPPSAVRDAAGLSVLPKPSRGLPPPGGRSTRAGSASGRKGVSFLGAQVAGELEDGLLDQSYAEGLEDVSILQTPLAARSGGTAGKAFPLTQRMPPPAFRSGTSTSTPVSGDSRPTSARGTPKSPAKRAEAARHTEYVLEPPLAELLERSDAELREVEGFKISLPDIGYVKFLEPVDLLSASPTGNRDGIERIPGTVVLLEPKLCTVYPQEDAKPPVGFGLNVPAEINLQGCWPIDKATKARILDERDPRHDRHMRKLEAMPDTQWVGFNNITGSWRFRVQHFSRYGLLEDEEEDDATHPPQPPLPRPLPSNRTGRFLIIPLLTSGVPVPPLHHSNPPRQTCPKMKP